ncbi:MAG TPA: F0F1 ATP synthase subunit alpha, partial [Planctomycetes bacterium]|nr:F0F1 ATP synthase subunit alpha [Planctomycetota bacterium]
GDGVALATGLDEPLAGELLDVNGVAARVDAITRDVMRLVLMGDPEQVEAGDPVRRLGRVLDVPAGPELIGRVVDPLGQPRDGQGPLRARRRVLVDGPPIALEEREPVSRPLRTGVFVLDTMIPVGRGQRQLIVGDRSTGKTELCLDILAAQDPDVVAIYVAVGRRGAEVAANVEWLRAAGVLERGFVVTSDADDPLGLIHLAPYSATAMAEDLMRAGRDVLIVYDDLTTHAHVHRSLALLLGRPVGREAFPADVFFAHARLLERATQLGRASGGGSLTALPIVETQAGDLSAFVPTNIVSITDGQIRLDTALAAADQIPAVDVSLSVSRVGGKAQPQALKRVAGPLKNQYAQFLEFEVFARFGSRLESEAQQLIEWGRRVRRALRQERGEALGWAESVAQVLALDTDAVAQIPVDELDDALDRALAAMRERDPAAWSELEQGHLPPQAQLDALKEAAETALAPQPAGRTT